MINIKNENNCLVTSFEECDWDKNDQLTLCQLKLFIPEFHLPAKSDHSKTLSMKINAKEAKVIVVKDYPMDAIPIRLSMSGYTDMRQAHLYILNTEDFPEINGHMYLSYYVCKNMMKELIFLLLTKRKATA